MMEGEDIFPVLMGILIFGTLVLVVIQGVGQTLTQYDYYSDHSLQSLNDASQTRGTFFLGSGSIGSCPVFVAYVRQLNGGFTLETFSAQKTVVYMDTNAPFVREVGTRSDFLFGFNWGVYRYELHVPRGTIIQQYSLDGKL